MSKRFWTVVLLIFCIFGAAASSYLYFTKDKQGPRITLPADRILYHEGADISVLLDGVTAFDNIDGDVSDSLMVEAVYPSANGRTAKVVYAALDSSNNVTKEQRMVDYEAEGLLDTTAETEKQTESVPVTEAPRQEPQSQPETQQQGQTTPSGDAYKEANIAVLNGSDRAGVAATWVTELQSEGFTNITSGNFTGSISQTIIYTEDEELLNELLDFFPNAIEGRGDMPTTGIDISLDEMDACVIVGQQDADSLTEAQ